MKLFKIGRRSPEATELLVGERARMLQYACYRLGNTDDAEDAVQDVLTKLHQRLSEGGPAVGNLTAYLYRSLANRCTSMQREGCRLQTVPLDGQAEPTDTDDEDREQTYRRISRLLAEIPDEQAEVIRLRFYGDKSFQEIADILGEPLPTVKSRLLYGLEKIRRKYNSLKDTE